MHEIVIRRNSDNEVRVPTLERRLATMDPLRRWLLRTLCKHEWYNLNDTSSCCYRCQKTVIGQLWKRSISGPPRHAERRREVEPL